MLAFYCEGEDVKKFMALLLSGNAFNSFELRSAEIMTRGKFTFDGRYNRDYDGAQVDRAYCLWSEVRQNFFDLIKGKRLPKYIKLVFALGEEYLENLHKNAKAAFINIVFENGKVTFTTGTAQRDFALDKSLDEVWENKVMALFKKLGISICVLR